jgi:hypothetical protein
MRTLIGDLMAAQESSGPVTVDIAQVRPIGSGWLISISLSAEAPLDQLVDLEDTVAQAAVDVGMAADVPAAKESITIG